MTRDDDIALHAANTAATLHTDTGFRRCGACVRSAQSGSVQEAVQRAGVRCRGQARARVRVRCARVVCHAGRTLSRYE